MPTVHKRQPTKSQSNPGETGQADFDRESWLRELSAEAWAERVRAANVRKDIPAKERAKRQKKEPRRLAGLVDAITRSPPPVLSAEQLAGLLLNRPGSVRSREDEQTLAKILDHSFFRLTDSLNESLRSPGQFSNSRTFCEADYPCFLLLAEELRNHQWFGYPDLAEILLNIRRSHNQERMEISENRLHREVIKRFRTGRRKIEEAFSNFVSLGRETIIERNETYQLRDETLECIDEAMKIVRESFRLIPHTESGWLTIFVEELANCFSTVR